MIRLAVLASHEGSTLQALIDACAAQSLDAKVVLVVSNNSKSGALRRAVAANIDTRHISIKTHGSEDTANYAIANALADAEADWVLLLGYMKKIGEAILSRFSVLGQGGC